MPLVQTIIGMIERDDLEVKDIISETDNSRAVATEWHYRGSDEAYADELRRRGILLADGSYAPGFECIASLGKLVRRDAAVSILRGQEISGEQAQLPA